MKDATKHELHIFREDLIEFVTSKGYDIGEDFEILYVADKDEHYIRTEEECTDRDQLISVTFYACDKDD